MSIGKSFISPMTNSDGSGSAATTPPLIIIVTGPTCSGKTTLARALSERFCLPLFHKDGFKEVMFDLALPAVNPISEVGITRDFSQLLGRFSLGCLEVALQQCARSGICAVFEANFDSALFSPRLSAIRQSHPFRVVQAHLRSAGIGQDDGVRETALLARFSARERTDRHPGHGAWRQNFVGTASGLPEDFGRELLRLHEGDKPLITEPGDDLIEIDTADFASVNFGVLFEIVEQRLVLQVASNVALAKTVDRKGTV
jgi:chloramphenicol 3-O-phosphotransferase